MTLFDRDVIDGDLAAARCALATVTLSEDAKALLAEAEAAIGDAPYLFVPLAGPGELDDDLRALAGLLSLRLYLTHHRAHPWLAEADAHPDAARALILALGALERERAALLPPGGLVALRYATAERLHPSPPSLTGHEPAHLPEVATLLKAWEEHDASALPWTHVVPAKLRQHYLFYRAFAYAPAFAVRRRRIRRLLPPTLRANAAMLETFSAIEQLGPILDNFVFEAIDAPLRVHGAAVADFSFLYMQLADEVVDTVLHATDADTVRALVARLAADPSEAAALSPFTGLDETALRSIGLELAHPVPKYATTLGGMLEALAALRAALEDSLRVLENGGRHRARVRAFFDHCFSTFVDELHLPMLFAPTPLDRLPLAETQWHGYRKNNLVMMRSVALRMELLGVPVDAHLSALRAWGHVLASFQVFDDMKDLFLDLGLQPSYPLQLAATHAPEEYAAIERAAPTQRRALDQDEPPSLARLAPKTVLRCLQLARLMAHAHFDWLTHYVADYRWRRSWLVRARSFHLAPRGDSRLPVVPRRSLIEDLDEVVAQTDALRRELFAAGDQETYLAYVLDVIGYDHSAAIVRAALPNLHVAYRFVNLRMRMSAREKARLLRRVLARHRDSTTTAALLSLVDSPA